MFKEVFAIKSIYKGTNRGGYYGNQELYKYRPSKCKLITELTEYYVNVEPKKRYEVVFPEYDSDNNYVKEIKPEFNWMSHHNCVNSEMVDNIYETMEEAEVAAKELNEKLQNSYCWMVEFGNELNLSDKEKVKNEK